MSIPDTVLDYPVMHTPDDPEKYIHLSFDGEYASGGTLFMDFRCTLDCGNYVIYGHNMKNGSMFKPLFKYEKQSYWEENPVIYFDTLYEQGEYEIMSVFRSRVFNTDETGVFRYYNYTDLTDPAVFDEFVSEALKASSYDTGVEASYGDSFITLITCAYHTDRGRLVVIARKSASE